MNKSRPLSESYSSLASLCGAYRNNQNGRERRSQKWKDEERKQKIKIRFGLNPLELLSKIKEFSFEDFFL